MVRRIDPRVSVLLLILAISAIGILIRTEPQPTAFAITPSPSIDPSVYDLLASDDEVRVVVIYRENARDRGVRILSEHLPDSRLAERIEVRFVSGREVARLATDPAVERIIPDVRVSTALTTSRPIIGVDDAWAVTVNGVGLSGAGQTVCVIDTGVDYTHPSLGGCTSETVLSGECSKVVGGYDYVNLDADPWDDEGHGTHVAGIIAANGSVIGVAPKATIVAIKALDENGEGWLSDTMLGVEWCTNNREEHNISVISMSLGSDQRYQSECDALVPEWAAIVDAAVAQNISVVSATGNTASVTSIAYPSCLNASMRVGATSAADAIASFTNRAASFPDIILAPGVLITSTMPGGTTAAMSGTSMATPHVSGVIALLNDYLRSSGSEERPRTISEAIAATGLPVDDDGKSNATYHRIDAYALIRSFDDRPPMINESYGHPIAGTEWIFSWSVTDDVALGSVLVTLTTPNETIIRTDAAGDVTIPDPWLGAYAVRIEANDSQGNDANLSEAFFVRAEPEYSLLIDAVAANRSYFGSNEVAISVELTTGEIVELFINGSFITASNETISYEGTFETPGTYTVLVRHNETDEYHASERSYTITIFDEAPSIASRTPEASAVSIAETTSALFAVEALAPEPEQLVYAWTINATPAGSDANLTVEGMTLDPGVYAIEAQVTYNASNATESWNLTITPAAPNVAETPAAGPVELAHDAVRSFSATGADVKDRALSYAWTFGGEVISTANETQLNASLIDPGTLTLAVSNGYAQTLRSWAVSILAEPLPLESTASIPDLRWDEGESWAIALADHFSAVDGVAFTLETALPISMSVSSGIATLSADDAYSGSGTARIGAERGSETALSNEFSIVIDERSRSSGGGGGGSSSSPPREPEPEPEVELAPEPLEVVSVESVGSFDRVEARLVEPSSGSRVNVRVIETLPERVEPFRGRVYSAAEITVEDAVEEVSFSFTVPFAWIESEGVEADAIALHRYTSRWEPLETELLGFSDGSYRYRALAPGLSVFVIGVREREEPVAIATDAPLYAFPDAWNDELAVPDEARSMPIPLLIAPLALVLFVILLGRKFSRFSS